MNIKMTHRRKEMMELAKQGMSGAKIAKKFGITRQRVHQILKQKGVFKYVPNE